MTTVTDSRLSFTIAFLAIPSIVGYARKTAEAHLVQWQLSTTAVDDSLIVVSELVTNGVRAKLGEDVRLTLTLLERHVLIEVWDCVPDLPEPKQPASLGDGEQDDPGGRGLSMVVEGLSDFWGVRPDDPGSGKTVYALVRHAPPVERDNIGQFQTPPGQR